MQVHTGPDFVAITYPVLRSRAIAHGHDGLRVAQLSDVHVGLPTPKRRARRAVDAINDHAPDVTVITGDFVTASRYPLRWIEHYLGGIRGPVVCVLGNHDHFVGARAVRSALTAIGYRVLANDAASLDVRGSPVFVLGVDDGATRRDDVPRTLASVHGARSRFVIAHTPRTAEKLPRDAGLVCFSGHMHGGQIRVGKVTDLLARHVLGEPYLAGAYDVNGNLLYVNAGLAYGRGTPLPRWRTEPELTIATLRAA